MVALQDFIYLIAREQSPVPKHMVHPLSWEKLHLFLRKFRKHSYTGTKVVKGQFRTPEADF